MSQDCHGRQEYRSRKIVYTDGSCDPNPSANMGIGVYSIDCGISISRTIREFGTNNVAECLAVIEALEEVKRRGLRHVAIKTDSRLVVNWVLDKYEQRSLTARTYVPTILKLLEEVDGVVWWIPRNRNLADPLSRHSAEPSPTIESINRKRMDCLRFRDFHQLKSGRDEFSRLRLSQLRQMVQLSDCEQAEAEFPDHEQLARCLRWRLRGLNIDKAIRKVNTDLEVGENAKRRR